MKSNFSITWQKSTQPRKQRKFRMNAPLHIKGKFLNSPLSKELRTKYSKRTLRVRKGDKVKVARGQFKGLSGVVENVDTSRSKIFVAGVNIIKKDGAKIAYPVDPSKVMITELILDDKKRINKLKKSD